VTYTKPEVVEMGNASSVIQQLTKANSSAEAIHVSNSPAYDLDE
jgi:hypothetical protein